MATKVNDTLELDARVPDPQYARAHDEDNLGMIERALREVGAGRSIVIDEDNVVLAGNGVLEAARRAGFTTVRVVEAAGDALVAVRRANLDEDDKVRLAVYDNRAAETSRWIPQVLQALEVEGLTHGIFRHAELRKFTEGLAALSYKCPRCKREWSGQPRPPFDGARGDGDAGA